MRQFTEKDKAGLTVAFRVFVRALNGTQARVNRLRPILEKALDEGISVDALLNRRNWERALGVCGPEMDASDYVSVLIDRKTIVKELREEPMWHRPEEGFFTLAEAVHDFFIEVTGKGGQWTTQAAITLLAKALQGHSLQSVLSEELIRKAAGDSDPFTYFNYISAVAADLDTLGADESPTEAQMRRAEEDKAFFEERAAITQETAGEPAAEIAGEEGAREMQTGDGGNPDDKEGEGGEAHKETGQTAPADECPEAPYPDPDPEEEPEEEISDILDGFQPGFSVDPRALKISALKESIQGCRPSEISAFAEIVTDITDTQRSDMTLTDLIYYLADGRFDPKKESFSLREAHRALEGDLTPAFLACLRTQNIEMSSEDAAHYDILHDNWDLRPRDARKLFKLQKLVQDYINMPLDPDETDPQRINRIVDDDIEQALQDLARLYKSKE